MKNIEIIFTLAALLATGFEEITAQSVLGIWSGSVSFHEIFVGQTGHGETHITVNITDNIATGNISSESEAKIAGVLFSKGACSGSGQAELHQLIVNKAARTYLIEVIAPSCIGESYNYASKKTIPSDPKNKRSVSVSSKNLINLNALAGSETKVQDVSGMGTVTTTITWNLTRSVDGELIVTPEDYDNWLPKPGKNDFLKGSLMNISLKLLGRNGRAPKVKAKSFEVSLSNTSREPGITLNTPLSPTTNQLPDLRLLKYPLAESKAQDQFLTIPCSDGSTGKVSIGAYDGGGWTTLMVEAILDDDTRIKGNLLVAGGIQDIPIPKRTPGSKIATAWLIANGDPGEMDDKESSAGNPNNGDGLTAYEEYRGVISEGEFRRLDPNEKELGVVATKEGHALFSEGLTWFENATNVKVIRFSENEIDSDRQLNKNFSSAHNYNQYTLRLEKKHVRRNVFGRTAPAPGIPATVTRVMIDYDQIVLKQLETEQVAKKRNLALPYTLNEILAKTVAHELGHGVNIHHHGNDDLLYVNRKINSGDPVRIYFPYGTAEETTRPYTLEGLVGKTGNQGSGDIFCIMNYNPSYDWAVRETSNSYIFYMVPLLSAGNLMCNSSKGTDINSTPDYFGDATVGNCLGQIKLK